MPLPYVGRDAFANNVTAWLVADQDEEFSWRNRSFGKYSNYRGGSGEDYYDTGFDLHDGVIRFSFALFNTSYEKQDNGYPGTTMWKLYDDAEAALKVSYRS